MVSARCGVSAWEASVASVCSVFSSFAFVLRMKRSAAPEGKGRAGLQLGCPREPAGHRLPAKHLPSGGSWSPTLLGPERGAAASTPTSGSGRGCDSLCVSRAGTVTATWVTAELEQGGDRCSKVRG